jgi:uncharacterized protein (TIGR00730 family)
VPECDATSRRILEVGNVRIAVFTGAATGVSDRYGRAVAAFGRELAAAGVGVVYGGGRVGLMGALADAALAAGGEVIGVMPRSLVDAEIAHPGLADLRVVGSMHERKATMAALADAFVALPGGAGTLDELFEAWTWQQLGLHAKPVGLLNVAAYWDPLLAALDHMSVAGFVRPADRRSLIVAADTAELLKAVALFIPAQRKWEGGDGAAPVESVAWVVVRDGRILAVRSAGRDVFYLPGGKIEPGETAPAALARELFEELALSVVPEELAERFTVEDEAHGMPGRRLRMTCFTGPVRGTPTPGREIVEAAWLGRADASRCAPAVRQVLDRLAADGELD